MARDGNLTAKAVENLSPKAKPYRISAGGGLLLTVSPSGSKTWTVRWMLDGQRRDMGLGGYPTVSLAEARSAAQEARKLVKDKLNPRDPIAVRNASLAATKAAREQAKAEAAKAKLEAAEAKARTFAAVAETYISIAAPGWKSAKTATLWRQSLADYVFPNFGDKPVNAITRADVVEMISPLWASRPQTAKKVLHRTGAVLKHAAFKGYRPNDNITARRDLIENGALPKATKKSRKQPALPWRAMPAFMQALAKKDGIAPIALRFLILTAVRSNEARGARWNEIDFQAATWTIPGERMKTRANDELIEPHRVPLAPQALEILHLAYAYQAGRDVTLEELRRLATLKGNALIFATTRDPRKSLSDNAVSKICREMNENQDPPPWRDNDGRPAVPHGFRASFRTWADDTHPTEIKAAEAALGHREGNQVVAAYARSDVFERRIPLMQAWADHCHQVPGQVVSMVASKPAREAMARSS